MKKYIILSLLLFSSSYASATPLAQVYLNLVNDHRIELGLKPLLLVEDLSSIAQAHSEGMADGKVDFGHDGFSERCSESFSVLGGGNFCAENVAMGQRNPDEVYQAWMSSPGHKSNIEEPRITHTGVGVQKRSDGTLYWTQIFIESN